MDTHYGKYQGPMAALIEHWMLDGNQGNHSFSHPDLGEGTEIFDGPISLSWEEARYLMGEEFECTAEEMDELAQDLIARAVQGSWDSQGFVYGWPLRTAEEYAEAIRLVDEANAQMDEEESS